MKHIKKTSGIKGIVAAGLLGLASLTQTASAQTNGGVTYFASENADKSHIQLDHSTRLTDSTRVSGFMDLHNKGRYFGKTSIDQNFVDRFGLRAQAVHANEYLTQAGLGLNYRIPTPKGTFAVVRYAPLWFDGDGNHISDKSTLGYFASVNLPEDFQLFGFGEINIRGNEPSWAYGETELSKKVGDNLSVGLNLQLNGQGEGRLTPKIVPRVALRAKF